MINEEAKNLLVENSNTEILSEDEKKEHSEKRQYFLTNYNKDKIAKLDRNHYFQGRGIKEGNFTYDLEWGSKFLGSIGGGSVYKFGYEKNFEEIKKFLIKILSAKNSIKQFYTTKGDLTPFSNELINDSNNLKGIARAFVGKVLSIYFPEIFINIFGHQDVFLSRLYSDYKPEYHGVELYLRNNYLLLGIKNKYVSHLTNSEFSYLLYKLFTSFDQDRRDNISMEDKSKIDALEVQHYQSLIHRNFAQLFGNRLQYFDLERQNEKNGQFDTQEVGILDFLAIDKNNDFVVIELKRSSSDATLGQLLRYMGWVNKNLCDKKQKVRGIIIAESKDNRLDYAMTIVPDVEFKKMKLNVEIEI